MHESDSHALRVGDGARELVPLTHSPVEAEDDPTIIYARSFGFDAQYLRPAIGFDSHKLRPALFLCPRWYWQLTLVSG